MDKQTMRSLMILMEDLHFGHQYETNYKRVWDWMGKQPQFHELMMN